MLFLLFYNQSKSASLRLEIVVRFVGNTLEKHIQRVRENVFA